MIKITKKEAQKFILKSQGLIGNYRYKGEKGILDFVKKVGCLQFDPIDICGKNADLVLFSRVEDYDKKMLSKLLYEDFSLVEQWDKNMSIYLASDWNNMLSIRNHNAHNYEKNLVGLEKMIEKVRTILNEKDFLEAKDVNINEEATFYTWRHKKLSQAIIDYLFFKGEAIIHHRSNNKRFFGKTDKYLKDSTSPFDECIANEDEFHLFQMKRRIGATSIIKEGPSDAYLGIYNLNAQKRKEYIKKLLDKDLIVECKVEDIKEPFYILKSEENYLNNNDLEVKRVEFIAPLDNFIWDRKLIKKIFDFSYTWEIYTPQEKRKYGAYVLPLLYKDELIGRIEMSVDSKNKKLVMKNLWFEKSIEDDFWNIFNNKVEKFATFNDCNKIDKKGLKVYYEKEE